VILLDNVVQVFGLANFNASKILTIVSFDANSLYEIDLAGLCCGSIFANKSIEAIA
jgi:hypothetical protein